MIVPEPGHENQPQTSLLVLLRNNLLVSALIFTALEIWRPYFFLTDDNLDCGLPFFMEMGNHLLHGQSPFYSDHLFGGNYNYLRDPMYFLWHPLYLIVSLLAGTPLHCEIIDVDAFFFLMVTTAGFVTLASHLRREIPLKISDGWIMFCALSFTYSMIALTTGASWLNFLASESALPWLALGIVQKTWRRGIGIVTLASLHQILGGHLSPTVSSSIFLSVFALGLSISRKSIMPLGSWLIGYAAALILILPLLMPMVDGFSHSIRSHGATLDDMQLYAIPAGQFPTSLFLGMAVWLVNYHYAGPAYTTYTVALGACAASWCLVPAVLSRVKWSRLEILTFGLMLLGVLMVCRPLWIAQVMLHLPLFRSMRWPFRELIQLQFFLHLFVLIRSPGSLKQIQKYAAIGGACVLVIPLFLYPLPPTFNSMNWDRELLTQGGFAQYWKQVRPLLLPTDRVAVIIPFDLYEKDRFEEPYSLLGTYDYATMAGIVNLWGYSQTAPLDQIDIQIYAWYPFGAYRPEQRSFLLKHRPEIKFITLESLHPLKITLSSGTGPTIDLTPFVPPRRNVP
jgi:hypothetical protein